MLQNTFICTLFSSVGATCRNNFQNYVSVLYFVKYDLNQIENNYDTVWLPTYLHPMHCNIQNVPLDHTELESTLILQSFGQERLDHPSLA